jgi:raffinose/stachyose/melibiose transport system permease protein
MTVAERAVPGVRAARRVRWRHQATQALIHGGLIIWGLLSLYPMVWIIFTSLKYQSELYQNPFALPANWVWSNYQDAWIDAGIGQFFLNSFIVTVVSTILVLFLGSTCGFVLARFEFRLKGLAWAYILFGFLIPATLMLIPLDIVTRTLGLYDSVLGLSLVYAAAGVPFHTFFLRAYMETIPRELEEAAVADGAGMWAVYWRVMCPLARPALTTMGTFNVLFAWSEFVFALFLTGTNAARTIPVGVSLLRSTFLSNDPGISAGMVISLVPAVLAFAFLQRYVVQGLTAGALKA